MNNGNDLVIVKVNLSSSNSAEKTLVKKLATKCDELISVVSIKMRSRFLWLLFHVDMKCDASSVQQFSSRRLMKKMRWFVVV